MNKIILSLAIAITGIIGGSKSLNAQTWNTFNTNYGYIQLGPATSS